MNFDSNLYSPDRFGDLLDILVRGQPTIKHPISPILYVLKFFFFYFVDFNVSYQMVTVTKETGYLKIISIFHLLFCFDFPFEN